MVEFGLVSSAPHCSLQLSSAGLIVVLVPGCCRASAAFSVRLTALCAYVANTVRHAVTALVVQAVTAHHGVPPSGLGRDVPA